MSSVLDSIVVVTVVVVIDGVYVGLGDVVDSYIGRSLTVVDSISIWSISIIIASVPKSKEMVFQKHYAREIINTIYEIKKFINIYISF